MGRKMEKKSLHPDKCNIFSVIEIKTVSNSTTPSNGQPLELFLYRGRTDVKILMEKAKHIINLRADVIYRVFHFKLAEVVLP
jgi:hypothetical protein